MPEEYPETEENRMQDLDPKARLEVVGKTSEEEKTYICRGLFQYNVDATAGVLTKPGISIELFLKDDAGQVMGGILCDTFSYCVYIDVLWVDERLRGQGYGEDLMTAAEKIARENGCTFAHTTTFSYQAPDFYQRMGYQIFGEIDDYPNGIKQYFLKKKL